MALTFEQIELSFHKWAHFFENKYFEHWELINSAWLDGKVRFLPQSKIKYASYRIKCDMKDYMRRISLSRRKQVRLSKGKTFPSMINFSDLASIPYLENDGAHPLKFEDILRTKNIDIGSNDFVHFVTNHSSLSRQEKLIMILMYIEGFTQREAGEVCGVVESRVNQVHTNIMARLRSLDYSKVI